MNKIYYILTINKSGSSLIDRLGDRNHRPLTTSTPLPFIPERLVATLRTPPRHCSVPRIVDRALKSLPDLPEGYADWLQRAWLLREMAGVSWRLSRVPSLYVQLALCRRG